MRSWQPVHDSNVIFFYFFILQPVHDSNVVYFESKEALEALVEKCSIFFIYFYFAAGS